MTTPDAFVPVAITVNGVSTEHDGEARTLLVQYVREVVGWTWDGAATWKFGREVGGDHEQLGIGGAQPIPGLSFVQIGNDVSGLGSTGGASNTNNLARICEQVVPTFHVDDSGCVEGPDRIRHKPVASEREIVTEGC